MFFRLWMIFWILNARRTGKSIGKDAESAKATFPAVYGITILIKAEELTEKAREILAPLWEKALKLDILAEYLLGRKE